ncbi:MAG: amino acid racemase [Myxococcota bacterium]
MSPQTAVPGILGGLGPLAHVELERQLVEEGVRRGAAADGDHPVWLLVSATDVPDRTASLGGRAPSCVPWLVRHGNRLHAAGADFLVVPCHTAHAFYAEVSPLLRLPWLHLPDETAAHVARAHPRARRVGLLATDGTLASGVHAESLAGQGLRALAPEPAVQADVMRAIYDPDCGIKARGVTERARWLLLGAAAALVARGAEVVVLGCTELSVALRDVTSHAGASLVDPLRVLAAATLDRAFRARTALPTTRHGAVP